MYLEQFFDSGVELRPGDTIPSLELEECLRIQQQAKRIIIAREIPRRLGDVSNDELALDKKRCRRVLHVLEASMASWSWNVELKDSPITPDDRAEGAQLNWNTWWTDHRAYLENRRRYIATWGITSGESAWAKKAITNLTNELTNLDLISL